MTKKSGKNNNSKKPISQKGSWNLKISKATKSVVASKLTQDTNKSKNGKVMSVSDTVPPPPPKK